VHLLLFLSCGLKARMDSEYHESTTCIPTWFHAYGQEETLSRYVLSSHGPHPVDLETRYM
jgi:hypothetical protein